MSNFKFFQEQINLIGGIWSSEDVYYSQLRDGYYANYKPSYPIKTKEDMCLFWNGNGKYQLLAQIGQDGNEWLIRDFVNFQEMKNVFMAV